MYESAESQRRDAYILSILLMESCSS